MIVKVTHDKGEKVSIHDANSIYINHLPGNKADVNIYTGESKRVSYHFDDFSPLMIDVLSPSDSQILT